MNNPNNHLLKSRQEQLLKLVAHSFYRELINYGVASSDIVTVSMHLLDHITESHQASESGNRYFSSQFTLNDILNSWKQKQRLQIDGVWIHPLTQNQAPQVCKWLQQTTIQETFINYFPNKEFELINYFFKTDTNYYFGIHTDEDFVGIIGAENMDDTHKKLEMKKFVGAPGFGGKGIGKRATFLFLYYAFMILHFHKVYIHTMDTNIRNINLNSKFGFNLEGIFFQEVNRSREFLDVVRMGLLKEDWLKIFSSPTKYRTQE